MKKIIMAMLFAVLPLWAQEAAAPDTSVPAPPWKHSLVGSLLGNQVTYSDWVQGGENAIAWNSLLDGKSVYEKGHHNWSNTYKFAFGRTRLGDKGFRKTDDRIELESVFTYKLNVYINPYVAATFKSQFAPGLNHDDKGVGTKVSKFMDPGYITQSAGVGYQFLPQAKIRVGAALREILTSDYVRFADDPKTSNIEKHVIEGGMESVLNVDWKLSKNLLLTSVAEWFGAYKDMKRTTLRTNNTLTASVSKLVTVNFNVQTINEPRISLRPQLKQTLGIGLNYSFF